MAGKTTIHWSPSETSLRRSSFNALIARRQVDTTEIMVRQATMGQASMMGPGWEPSAITSRRIAESLTSQKEVKKPQCKAEHLRKTASQPLLLGGSMSLAKPKH
mmetsp:Transcript_4528/g.10554  ORF Transcript_4528/g.10554 Transcript_4528/m.10554 type:complete len:104 (+) Transcript_4528:105-416(+)